MYEITSYSYIDIRNLISIYSDDLKKLLHHQLVSKQCNYASVLIFLYGKKIIR